MNPQALSAVPHLTTALQGPLEYLESHLLMHQMDIEQWFRQQWQLTSAPFYTSVDLRNAGFKLAPVDTNLFPAGFNNLNSAFLPLCIQAVQSALERINIEARQILLVPENHTRNTFYLESVATLKDFLEKAGYAVQMGSLSPDIDSPQTLSLPSGQTVEIAPLERDGDVVRVGDFVPCLIILNNDMAGGRPPILENIRQKVVPPLWLGWSNRLKSKHFGYYREVAQEFSELVEIDPWLIDPLFRNCGEIDFMKQEGSNCLVKNVNALLVEIEKKYQQYGVSQAPFVVVKADAGTYGMGVMTVHSSEEMLALNRKQRTRMSKTKEGQKISKVIIQEGVYTFETWSEAVAEPVVYMIDHYVVGGFYRVHKSRSVNENLNSPGMHFEPLAFADSCITPNQAMAPDACPNRFYAYGVVARLALLAAAREVVAYSRN